MFDFLKRVLGRENGSTAYDAQTWAVMDRVLRRDSASVDVGAHVGTVLQELVRRAPAGRHYAFEPLPACFAKLQKRFGGTAGVELFQLALAEEAGASSFQHVVSRPTYSGLRRRRYDHPNEQVVTIDVQCARLDDALPADARVDFVKVDVEGGEYGVFRGGIKTLQRCRPVIVFEHGLGGADHYGTEPEHVYDLLHEECALQLSTMERFLAGESALTSAQFADDFRTGHHYYFMAYPG